MRNEKPPITIAPFIKRGINDWDELSFATAYNDGALDAFNGGGSGGGSSCCGIVGHDEIPLFIGCH